MYIGFYVKYPISLSDFNETWILSRVSKNTQMLNFVKIRPVGAELFHANGQADEADIRLFAILRTRLKVVPDCWVQDDMVDLRRI